MKQKRREKFVQAITVAAMMTWIITAREIESLQIQEVVLFVVSTVWLVLFVIANKKIWK